MNATASAYHDIQDRARRSQGTSNLPIYAMVSGALEKRHPPGGVLADVGCGTGNLWRQIRHCFDRYIGVDAVAYEGFPAEAEFLVANLDSGSIPLPNDHADVVVGVETIEHLENPRAFVRELVRLAKPGGWVAVTTPNQLSLLSKLTLMLKNQFNAFRDGSYPAHLTALLETDLRRIASENNLTEVATTFSRQGRIVMTPWHFLRFLSRLFPRTFSDNVLLIGRKNCA